LPASSWRLFPPAPTEKIDNGDKMRGQFGMNDRDLIRGLRALLPQYRGRKPLTLYRGEGAENVRRRTYGLSWTGSSAVAEDFANRWYRTSKGGSAPIRVQAPPEAS
jgi:hypothetical protein